MNGEMMKNEDDFRKDLMNVFDKDNIWNVRVEPARGMKPGIPDLNVLLCGYPFFVELKVGTFKDGRLFPREVRPAQIGWHRKFNEAGGKSLILVGVEFGGGWNVFCLTPNPIEWNYSGIPLEACFLTTMLDEAFTSELNHAIQTSFTI